MFRHQTELIENPNAIQKRICLHWNHDFDLIICFGDSSLYPVRSSNSRSKETVIMVCTKNNRLKVRIHMMQPLTTIHIYLPPITEPITISAVVNTMPDIK
jgi:hypothetical protein